MPPTVPSSPAASGAAHVPGAGPPTAAPTPPAAALDLRGTRVLVTGASGGIGRSIVVRFLAAGATVVAQHRSPTGAASLQDLAATVSAAGAAAPARPGAASVAVEGAAPDAGPAVVPLQAELADPEAAAALVAAAVERVGHLDVLVNNAGVQDLAPLATTEAVLWERMLAVNLTAAQVCTAAFAAHRRQVGGGGAVVHVASIEGQQPADLHGAYAVSKAALRMHARAAAAELGADGIRVNTVSPGLIDRPGLDADWPEGVARWNARVPLGRLGRPEDVADACLVLASPLLGFVTGAELVVDGGMLTRATW